jgi:TGF-beta propeptide
MLNFVRRASLLPFPLEAALAAALVVSLAGASMALGHSRPHSRTGAPGRHYRRDLSPTGVELPRLRTATSRTYRNSDGTLTKTLFAAPVNYRSRGGWQPIDSRLVSTLGVAGGGLSSAGSLLGGNDSGYAWRTRANSFGVLFKPTFDDGFMRFDTGGQSFRFSLDGARSAAGEVSGNTIVYRNALPGVSVEEQTRSDGVKETLSIANRSAPLHYRFAIDPPPRLPVTAKRLPDGAWAFRAGGMAEPAFVLASPSVSDSAPGASPRAAEAARATKRHVAMRVSRAGHRYYVELDVDRRWARDPHRRFPLKLDPTTRIQPTSQDAFFDASCGGCTLNGSQEMRIGTDGSSIYRAALQFDLSQVPAGVNVTSATLGLYYAACLETVCGKVSHQLDAYRMTSPWSVSSTTGNLSWDPTVVASYTVPVGATPGQWMSWGLTSIVNGWLAGSTPNYGLMIKRSSETSFSGGVYAPAASYQGDGSLTPRSTSPMRAMLSSFTRLRRFTQTAQS